MNDRYDSVTSVQRDLQLWLEDGKHQGEPTLSRPAQPVATPISTKRSTSLRIRSRGLRPYGEDDADCYLSLVPGPRDRSGIPDSILFWKNWIESDDPDTDYPVGVLYGPSGSGKHPISVPAYCPKLAVTSAPCMSSATVEISPPESTESFMQRFTTTVTIPRCAIS